ncbi:uncharacterized protein [Aegilops tauschii subsp. strangulata]|uniref:uncharacterized protein n=1 Tax=Aegilops tauschii subsp. strangulata TaxID=200361 RepID=UPI001ABBE84D|nr:uncharacterized protein LOC109743214 [Aegilops tauschii subsp. strangulata]XP_044443809.1 uncharacterized protein LOC123170030 isoform X1 [Triticum aestivum]XP_045086527.1 uncharacterized protein LOC109749070 isoform X2 [Aegilops tauschii subsp. strangulata]
MVSGGFDSDWLAAAGLYVWKAVVHGRPVSGGGWARPHGGWKTDPGEENKPPSTCSSTPCRPLQAPLLRVFKAGAEIAFAASCGVWTLRRDGIQNPFPCTSKEGRRLRLAPPEGMHALHREREGHLFLGLQFPPCCWVRALVDNQTWGAWQN